MFVINLNYKAKIEVIDKYLLAHRDWLQQQYDNGKLLCSGPKTPRDGGIIIALDNDKSNVEKMMLEDPFTINGLSEYQITEFEAVKCQPQVKDLIVSKH